MRAVALLALAAATPATAQTIKPLAEARLRYEHAEQDGLPLDADAVTMRVRAGVEASTGGLSALVEAQGNLAIVGDYLDGLHGVQTRPLVADPQNVAIYRAQLRYARAGHSVTLGRQRIALDDERFVGNIPFRQNAQTFDAVRGEFSPMKGVRADFSYVWSVRTLWGIDGNGARQRAISGDTVLANLAWASPIGTLTGFGYWIDQDEAAVQGFRLSSRTLGVRLAGTRSISGVKLAYAASYARQVDHHRNPNDYQADYWTVDAALDLNGPRIGGGYEVFGAGDGRALTSFQTPLAANFKFNGWAEKFTIKPADGLRDLYAGAGWGWKAVGPLRAVTVSATWHRFESDRLIRHYGDEIDLLAQARIGRTTAAIRYADYRADRFATDTRKLWLQLDWTI
ncbi:hypothetical protein COC42_07315 [Sphingomonas spermidinifaciens]|uniref:Alginate export domain-containing protein n=1 Tax=Sphingomonas spermidinifaciens TaxID=1141889 RepID=A0A2A4B8Z3_9SPHN|nr:hypothetical protein [Sphingomonas spermidinifaciens]PCD04104.1 hypothetical protein COC42_07315 [Sphingomonas spermidinifaciens]